MAIDQQAAQSGQKGRIARKSAGNYNIARQVASRFLLLVGGLLLVSPASLSQPGAVCPSGQKLTLDDVVQAIQHHLSEERRVELIESCHVSFSLDDGSLQRLENAGVSDKELDVLNPETAGQLSLEQAQAEVDGLERAISGLTQSMAGERDAALAKLTADYRARREKAANVEPRGQFETTAEYNERVRQSKAELSELDLEHENNAAQLTADSAAKLEVKSRPFQARIIYLKSAYYLEPTRATNPRYDPDAELLTATIGGEDYLFKNVAPATAKQVVPDWKDVTVARPYSEAEMETRRLRLNGTEIAMEGESLKKVEAAIRAKVDKALAEGRERETRNDFDGALERYQMVLALDANNQTGKVGAESMRQKIASREEASQQAVAAEQQRRAEAQRKMQEAHVWVDTRTSLMWTQEDNGADITWKGAIDYCKALHQGGYADWRLPSIEELEPLYDGNSTRETVPLPTALDWFSWGDGKSYSLPQGRYWIYHIAGNILLTRAGVWSTSDGRIREGNLVQKVIYIGDFTKVTGPGDRMWEYPSEKHLDRALCVRAAHATDLAWANQPVDSPSSSPSGQSNSSSELHFSDLMVGPLAGIAARCRGGDAQKCHTLGFDYLYGTGVEKDQHMALLLFEKACSWGNQTDCALAKSLQSKLPKQGASN